MSDKIEKKAGALHSELRIELHTQYAINTWGGRPASEDKPSLIGMPLFFKLISTVNRDSLADNPWADAALMEVETLLETASQQLQKWLNDIDALMAMLPVNASLSGVTSTAPLNIAVHSHTPLGYRCVYLLVGFDQLILRVFQAHHYGLMSLKERKAWLHRGSHQIRQIFSVALRYRSHPVTRQDIASNNDAARQAIEQFGELDKPILLGIRRSRFSPPVSTESIKALKAAFKRQSSKEKAAKQEVQDDQ
ncbi:PFL_4669 family integrating conjugative element protein [Escherichia sp. E4742]|uniref:PFL_4669 family integrating conjugative element protein n=1 Tax=Escherichia sp. E4742 TaxID=2044467 RepID=UPI0010812826|nr:TIGR03761 family integrating conjugative element protein [Escherichia sp. E4742]QCT87962.1 TIGR03761 family integrating conjugative element protein [Escherichia sp. E4742]TGB55513.1 TIGR03761 family integrating conjugative element protein [Escherichia sp. E4742]TLJ07192.1 TIGR03761 family integrating conjugative element protein [Escherichia sp. E4742]